MSEDFKNLAKKKMLEAKRKAKEELKKAKLKEKQKQLEQKRKDQDLKNRTKSYAKKVYDEILKPFYKHEGEYLKEGNLYIEIMEDGNICGKNGDEYFYSFQKDATTYIENFTYSPEFTDDKKEVGRFLIKQIALDNSGNVLPTYLKEDVCWQYKFTALYDKLKPIKDRVDEGLKKLENNSQR